MAGEHSTQRLIKENRKGGSLCPGEMISRK